MEKKQSPKPKTMPHDSTPLPDRRLLTRPRPIAINSGSLAVPAALLACLFGVNLFLPTSSYSTGTFLVGGPVTSRKNRANFPRLGGSILGTGYLGCHFFLSDEVPSAARPMTQALQVEHRRASIE